MGRYLMMVAQVLLLVPFLLAQSFEGHARVAGHVLDDKNHPIADATVTITPLEASWSGPLPMARTDAQGAYILDLPALGRTRMSASKTTEGYPDTSMYAIFANEKNDEPVVDLKDRVELAGVDIHLGPPDGAIELYIINKISGDPVPLARLTMKRKDTNTFYSTSIRGGIYSTPLPDKPISIEISAAGYHTWQESIDVASLQKRKVTVELAPE